MYTTNPFSVTNEPRISAVFDVIYRDTILYVILWLTGFIFGKGIESTISPKILKFSQFPGFPRKCKW